MAKKKKVITGVLITLAAIIIIAVAIVKFYLGGVIAAAATNVAGVETKVERASLSLLAGRFVLEGLEMKNPEGYTTPYFFKLKRCEVDADMGSLFSDTVVVEKILLDSMETSIEAKNLKYNFQVIIENLEKGKEEQKKKEEEGGKPAKGFRVDLIEIRDTKVNVHLIGDTVAPVRPGDIRLENIGSGEKKGVMLADIFREVLLSVCTGAVNMAGDVIPEKQKAAMKKGLDDTGALLKEAGAKTGKLLEKLGKPLFGKDKGER